MDRWARQLSPAARDVWQEWDEDRRRRAEQAMRAGEVEADPELALVVGEMQLITNRPYTNRFFPIAIAGWGFFYVVNAIVESPWWLLGAALPIVAFWQARRSRPLLRAGVTNLMHAGDAGHPIAFRYRERFDDRASCSERG